MSSFIARQRAPRAAAWTPSARRPPTASPGRIPHEREHVVLEWLTRRRRKYAQRLGQPLAFGRGHLAQHPIDGDAPMPRHPVDEPASRFGDGQGDVTAIIR